ncbi:MAG: hypothetical protein PWR01_401 [Clostridiales bacterium]|jgi:thioredoxin reductase|nr:hypothetical protein [Clostridiales bacterium]
MEWISINGSDDVPLIAELDLLVVGAGLAGICAAEAARSAHDELVSITGRDFGFYYERWIEELSTWPDQFEPIPWAQPLE